MLSHSAKKARLTFKLELDELWINTGKTMDDKIPTMEIELLRTTIQKYS